MRSFTPGSARPGGAVAVKGECLARIGPAVPRVNTHPTSRRRAGRPG